MDPVEGAGLGHVVLPQPRGGVAPVEVSFTDTSTGEPTSWTWDFGDGTTSTERNPVHTYAAAGVATMGLWYARQTAVAAAAFMLL